MKLILNGVNRANINSLTKWWMCNKFWCNVLGKCTQLFDFIKHNESNSQKIATFHLHKSAKNAKNNESKMGKKPFYFPKSIAKVR